MSNILSETSPGYLTTSPGYGRSQNKFQIPRSSGKVYPYIEDFENTEFEDDETEDTIHSKIHFPVKIDKFAAAGTDPFYFAAGNIKLSDCFERPDLVLKEIHALGDSMSPIPQKRNRHSLGRGAGSSFPSGVGSYKRTGTKRGYFSPPPELKFQDESIPKDDPEEDPVFNIEDLAAKQDKRNGTFSARRSIFNP